MSEVQFLKTRAEVLALWGDNYGALADLITDPELKIKFTADRKIVVELDAEVTTDEGERTKIVTFREPLAGDLKYAGARSGENTVAMQYALLEAMGGITAHSLSALPMRVMMQLLKLPQAFL